MRSIFPVALLLIMAITNHGYSQAVHSSKKIEPVLHHEIDGFIGSTHIPEGALDDSDATLIVPNIGFNYKYWFDAHFALGLYNNLVAINYTVNSDNHQDLERVLPFTTTLVGVFKPWKNLSFFAGPGLEIDKNKSLFVLRFGLDYAFSLNNDWYLSPRFVFDNLGGDIEAFTLGISVGRKF